MEGTVDPDVSMVCWAQVERLQGQALPPEGQGWLLMSLAVLVSHLPYTCRHVSITSPCLGSVLSFTGSTSTATVPLNRSIATGLWGWVHEAKYTETLPKGCITSVATILLVSQRFDSDFLTGQHIARPPTPIAIALPSSSGLSQYFLDTSYLHV